MGLVLLRFLLGLEQLFASVNDGPFFSRFDVASLPDLDDGICQHFCPVELGCLGTQKSCLHKIVLVEKDVLERRQHIWR